MMKDLGKGFYSGGSSSRKKSSGRKIKINQYNHPEIEKIIRGVIGGSG
jgi:hypothetical protein